MKLYQRTRLTAEQKRQVVVDVAAGLAKKDVARRYDISLRTLYSILKAFGPRVVQAIAAASAETGTRRGKEVKDER